MAYPKNFSGYFAMASKASKLVVKAIEPRRKFLHIVPQPLWATERGKLIFGSISK